MRSRFAWITLTAVLAVELVLGVVLVIAMVPTYPAAGPERAALVPLWVSLFVSVILCCAWVAGTLVGATRRRGRWVRGSAVTIHLLMLAAAVGVFQGVLGTPAVGALLLTLAIIGFVATLMIRGTGEPGEPGRSAGPAGAAAGNAAPGDSAGGAGAPRG